MILFSALLSIGAAAVQLYFSYQRDLSVVTEEFGIVEDSFLPGLEKALWEFNFPLVEVLLDGIVAQPDVVALELLSQTGKSWVRKQETAGERVLTREFPLVHQEGLREPRAGGVLSVSITLEFILMRLWDDFFTLILSNFAKTLLASIAMFMIFDHMVSRHLRTIATTSREQDWLTDNDLFQLDRNGTYDDELAQIVRALNAAKAQVRSGIGTLRAKNQELEVTAEKLREANREQAEFTYSISHDLKAPTNTIHMLIEELRDYCEIDDDGRAILGDMSITNKRMGQLVDDVLSYSRLVGEMPALEPVDLNALINAILRDLAGEVASTIATVEVDELPDIEGQPLQLRILFQNLISNAIKFHKPGQTPLVRITADECPHGTAITVADNGIGIPEQYHETVFGLFKRLHTQAEYDGTGLGLTICKRVMFNHGGKIALTTGIEGGAAVNLEFWAGQHDETN